MGRHSFFGSPLFRPAGAKGNCGGDYPGMASRFHRDLPLAPHAGWGDHRLATVSPSRDTYLTDGATGADDQSADRSAHSKEKSLFDQPACALASS
jgi:hypothetical protein